MPAPTITTPKGTITVTSTGKAELSWDVTFAPRIRRKYSMAQKFVDSEILRLSEPFIPLRTGMLVKSGTLGTEIGSGEVKWIAIYARFQYYSPRKAGSETGPLRGPFWFERMKKLYARKIVEGGREIMRRGG